MSAEELQHYLSDETRRGPAPPGAFDGAAGGAPCGDLIRISLAIEEGRIRAVTFEAEGCAAARAAAAATAELAEDEAVLATALIGPEAIGRALGGLTPQGRHAAELAADALHRALSAAASSGAGLASAPDDGERTLVALSGGVDSTVAALLERERGADVVAVTVKLWADEHNDGERSCCSPQAVLSARGISHSLGIPHLTLDLQDDFRAGVVDEFLGGYAVGRTPNPCVLCNGEVRIDAMVTLADRVGASCLATGHYARLADDGDGPLLAAPADSSKDQTYMLSGIRAETLARLRFPLAGLRKPEVRRLAGDAGLSVARKPESQDLCFLAGEGKRGFLARHGGLHDRPGALVDSNGKLLGEHRGHHNFTVGQRRGIGIGSPEPLYVLATDADSNRVTVGLRDELATTRVRVRNAHLHREGRRVDRVKLRYRSQPIECRLEGELSGPGGYEELTVALTEPAYGVAPGQTACLMEGDLVLGRGTIAA